MPAMWDALIAVDRVYAGWLVAGAFLGAAVFLKLAAEEWAYREAWLRTDAERRTKRATLEAQLARNQRFAEELKRAGQSALADGQSLPVAEPDQARQQGQAVAAT